MKGYLKYIFIISSIVVAALGHSSEKFFKSRKTTIYYLEPEPNYNWHQAVLECQRKNMTLLSVESRAKNIEVKNLLYRIYRGSTPPTFYIGGNDLVIFRKFIWLSSGQQFKYTNWYRNEPNNNDDLDERCVNIGYYGNEQWNDINCSWLYGFICEKTLILNGVRL